MQSENQQQVSHNPHQSFGTTNNQNLTTNLDQDMHYPNVEVNHEPPVKSPM